MFKPAWLLLGAFKMFIQETRKNFWPTQYILRYWANRFPLPLVDWLDFCCMQPKLSWNMYLLFFLLSAYYKIFKHTKENSKGYTTLTSRVFTEELELHKSTGISPLRSFLGSAFLPALRRPTILMLVTYCFFFFAFHYSFTHM